MCSALFSEVWSSQRTQTTPSVGSLDVQARDYVDPVALDRFRGGIGRNIKSAMQDWAEAPIAIEDTRASPV